MTKYTYLQSILISFRYIIKFDVFFLVMGHFDWPFTKKSNILMFPKYKFKLLIIRHCGNVHAKTHIQYKPTFFST